MSGMRMQPPYPALFAWLEGRGEAPRVNTAVRYHPVMLAHRDRAPRVRHARPERFRGGMEVGRHSRASRRRTRSERQAGDAAFSRTGEDISGAFPDLDCGFRFRRGAGRRIVGEEGGRVQDFNTLQQRLNRKTVTAKMMADYPAFMRVYDLISLERRRSARAHVHERRAKLEDFVRRAPAGAHGSVADDHLPIPGRISRPRAPIRRRAAFRSMRTPLKA